MIKITLEGEYQTRDGRAVRILCVDMKGGLPILALIDEMDYILYYGGGTVVEGLSLDYDLIPVPTSEEAPVHKVLDPEYVESAIKKAITSSSPKTPEVQANKTSEYNLERVSECFRALEDGHSLRAINFDGSIVLLDRLITPDNLAFAASYIVNHPVDHWELVPQTTTQELPTQQVSTNTAAPTCHCGDEVLPTGDNIGKHDVGSCAYDLTVDWQRFKVLRDGYGLQLSGGHPVYYLRDIQYQAATIATHDTGWTLVPKQPVKRSVTRWVNIYPDETLSGLHHRKDLADEDARNHRIACVPVEISWEE